jgi:DNA-binding response OmpR family regulator
MSDKARILLVEDDFNLGFVIQDTLKASGYSVNLCKDGKEGLQSFNQKEYDLCILDVMLPKKDGFSLAEDIRQTDTTTPIIFLTAKSLQEDKIQGLKVGADDYITKPFSTEEFLLRVEAVLKRTLKTPDQEDEKKDVFELSSYTFDYRNFQLVQGAEQRKLTKKEAEILKLLCLHKNQVLPRDLVLNMVWGDDSYFVGRSLDVFITKLRKYLKADDKIAITNVHGVGFKLEID